MIKGEDKGVKIDENVTVYDECDYLRKFKQKAESDRDCFAMVFLSGCFFLAPDIIVNFIASLGLFVLILSCFLSVELTAYLLDKLRWKETYDFEIFHRTATLINVLNIIVFACILGCVVITWGNLLK